MNTISRILICLLVLHVAVLHSSAGRVFFPFDNAFARNEPVEEQVRLLKELGYDGICSRPKNASAELLAALDKHELKLVASYVTLTLNDDEDAPVPKEVQDHIKALKGRDTIIWLGLNNRRAKNETAIQWTQRVVDLSAENGLKVVFYPHVGAYTDTVESCARLREQCDRPELGLSFTLCHFLRMEDHRKVEATLRSMASHLELVQINGANEEFTKENVWGDLIKPLDEGDFDIGRVLKTLDEIGYRGPVNLQCYQIKQPVEKHLKNSMTTWQRLNKSKR